MSEFIGALESVCRADGVLVCAYVQAFTGAPSRFYDPTKEAMKKVCPLSFPLHFAHC